MILQYSSKKICLQDVEATLSAEYDIWLCTCNDTVGTLFTETCVIWHLMYIDKSLQVQKYFVILQLHLHHKCKKRFAIQLQILESCILFQSFMRLITYFCAIAKIAWMHYNRNFKNIAKYSINILHYFWDLIKLRFISHSFLDLHVHKFVLWVLMSHVKQKFRLVCKCTPIVLNIYDKCLEVSFYLLPW